MMEVRLHTNYNLFQNTSVRSQKKQDSPIHPQMKDLSNYSYRDCHINFGARQTAAEFDPEKMPETMKQYLFENIEERSKMKPFDLQKEAFQYLDLCETVQDVKEQFPKEFENLKSFNDNKAKRGYLAEIRMTNSNNLSVFADAKTAKTDLPVYLLKKVYLEGKTLKQINKDFHNDVRPDFKLADGKYFTYADFKSMGVKIPDIGYWQSLLATKDDRTPRNYYGKILGKRELSTETKEKIREGQLNRHKNKTPGEKSKLALNLVTGKKKSESVFTKYQDHIMRISIHDAGIGDGMRAHFAELKNDVDFQSKKFANWDEKRSEMFRTFWQKHPENAQKLSEAILLNIANFKVAHACGEESSEMQELKDLSKKLKIESNERVKENARARRAQSPQPEPKTDNAVKKQISPKTSQFDREARIKRSMERKQLKENFRSYLRTALGPMPDGFTQRLIPFLVDHPDMTPEIMEMATTMTEKVEYFTQRVKQEKIPKSVFEDGLGDLLEVLNERLGLDDEFVKFLERTKNNEDKSKIVNNIFDAQNFKMKNSAEQALNEVIYDITKFPTVMGFSRVESVSYINERDIRDVVMKRKKEINSSFLEYQKGISKPVLERIFESNIMPMVPKMLEVDAEAAKVAFGEHWSAIREFIPSITDVPKEKEALFEYVEKVGGRLKFFLKENTAKVQRDGAAFGIVFDYVADEILPRVKKFK